MDVDNMFQMILLNLKAAWNAVYSWFVTLITATKAKDYIIAVILAMLVIRFLIYPFMKNRVIGGSDRARYNDDVMDAEYRRL